MPRAQAALEGLGYAQHLKAERPVALQAQREGEIQLMGRAPGSGRAGRLGHDGPARRTVGRVAAPSSIGAVCRLPAAADRRAGGAACGIRRGVA